MLGQFEKEKEKANGESSLGSSPSNSPMRQEDLNFYERLSQLMSERSKIRLQMREAQAEYEKQFSLDFCMSTKCKVISSKYEYLKTEMGYLHEDINSIVVVMGHKNDTKLVNTEEETVLDKLGI